MALAYTIKELAQMMQGSLHGTISDELLISTLLTDSRRAAGKNYVFFALKTSKNNGHKYIPELIDKGGACFVVSELPENSSFFNKAAFILVPDTLVALQTLAQKHREKFSLPVLGITGSNGKTIVKEWLSQLLAPDIALVKNPRSYNSQIGVPLSVWLIDHNHRQGIFEAGISRMGEMEHLERIIQPDTGIFTNIGPAHDEGFPDTRSKIMEKLRLFKNSKLLVFNSDQEILAQTIRQQASRLPHLRLFSWGQASNNDLVLLSTQAKKRSTKIRISYKKLYYTLTLPFNDKASLENIMNCLAFLFATGMFHEAMIDRIQHLSPIAMRMEMKHAINHCVLVNDAYSSDFLSLDIALDFLNAQAKNKKKVAILSDIRQSGMAENELYRKIAAILRQKSIQQLIGIGHDISSHKEMFEEISTRFFPDTKTFLDQFDYTSLNNMGILLKGAREFEFEQIGNKLQLKDHQTLLEINLDALVHNLNIYKGMLNPGTRIMAMVKAFSYGSGSFEIANVLQYHGVDYLAVAFADEGNELRNAGISLPIVVLNPELHNLDILFRYNLEPEIYSLSLLKRIASEAQHFKNFNAENPFPVHLKIDTGMHRLGFMKDEIRELITVLKAYPNLRVASVFSHFAASDLARFDPFTRQQASEFDEICQHLEKELGHTFLKHISNSAAITRFPEYHFDMVRVGIGLYGIDPSSALSGHLQNVTTFKTVVSQVKNLAAGESVGYNRAALLQKNTRIAIVPVGYADGLNRSLGNGIGYMMVNGQAASIIGNISMDMCCLDISGIDAAEGDEVIIFGEKPTIEEIAGKLRTIPYEVFTAIPSRVKRIYFSE